MTAEIKDWMETGTFINYGPFHHQVFVKQCGQSNASAEKTLLLLHGFPESSYSYHLVLDGLLKIFDRIILFDFIGFGMSDKPTENFAYSLIEQADCAFAVWHHFNITGGHILSHDMGDSVVTEIVARHEANLMPEWFSSGIQSLTFTNGSMILDLAKLRVTQKILLSKYGPKFSKLVSFKLFNQQILSAHGNKNISSEEIEKLWSLNLLQDGNKKTYLTIKYLNDRKQFEKTRWLPALAKCTLPIHICWGDEDQVARVEMAYYLKEFVCKEAMVSIMNGLGHFCQLASPEKWLYYVSAFYRKILM